MLRKSIKIHDLIDITDCLGLVTFEGKFKLLICKNDRFVHRHADTITELMLTILKEPRHCKGFWLWKFQKGKPFSAVIGLPFIVDGYVTDQ